MRVCTRFLCAGLVANYEFAGFRKKIHDLARFHGNGPYGKIPTKKEPITERSDLPRTDFAM